MCFDLLTFETKPDVCPLTLPHLEEAVLSQLLCGSNTQITFQVDSVYRTILQYVHVRVRRITDTRNNPVCTFTKRRIHVLSRVMICTFSSAQWQQASKHSVLRRFELILEN